MNKKWMIILSSIALLFIVIIVGATFYFYGVAIARADKGFLDDNPDLKVDPALQTSEQERMAWWNTQPFEDWILTSGDGLKLHAYFLKSKSSSAKTVILAHGYAGKPEQMGDLAQMYSEDLGYNVLIPDARGHGKSEGNYIGFGWPERKDYVQWIHQVLTTLGNEQQIVLHGVSMGGATVMMTSGEDLPSNVKAIVEDCGYTSAEDELKYQLKRMYHLPTFPLVQTTSLMTQIRAGYSFAEASALEQVKKSKTPMLFIHGDADLFVPSEMVYELYKIGPEPKKLYIAKGAGHGLARKVDPTAYDAEVTNFIAHYVK
ncbi:fermentation-respiration switch protein FrsA (DUF1100 family) [Paenibacillus shirakamiensis]|uniref:Fermentation-respiration switch protein FrsA (DUF1100 family) n=1 Tax=Paenibacillus shirakamiensis TaxID=1265935 RepID=A0ABS4JC90_9BACL|nr:alpha/beta hydrolase [Paenibacillus shirakamiensis]MBP1999290.1 fermentation-respiration switch protein FrsA (DUF1100 family) [Paenibacillus shirakamiensis]